MVPDPEVERGESFLFTMLILLLLLILLFLCLVWSRVVELLHFVAAQEGAGYGSGLMSSSDLKLDR